MDKVRKPSNSVNKYIVFRAKIKTQIKLDYCPKGMESAICIFDIGTNNKMCVSQVGSMTTRNMQISI
jgi:hypothetical protein